MSILKSLSRETRDGLETMVQDDSFKHVVEAVSALQYNAMLEMTDPDKVDKNNIQGYQQYFRGLMGIVEMTEDVVNFKRMKNAKENNTVLEPINLKETLMINIRNKFNQIREFFKN